MSNLNLTEKEREQLKTIIRYMRVTEKNIQNVLDLIPSEIEKRKQTQIYTKDQNEADIVVHLSTLSKFDNIQFQNIYKTVIS